MCRSNVRRVTPIVIFLFIFLMGANSFSISANSGKGYQKLMESGESFLTEGEYEKATDEFFKALPLIKDTKTLAILYQLLSRAYFKMGHKDRCEESLRKMFENDPGKKISSDEHENEYMITFNKVKAEYWYNLRTVSEEEEELEQKIIEKLAQKPKKKKNKLIRILVLAGVVVMLGVATVLLLTKMDKAEPQEPNTGTLRVSNGADFMVLFTIGDIIDALNPLQSKEYTFIKGSYVIKFYDDTHSITKTFAIYPKSETWVWFLGWDESIGVQHIRK